MKNLKKIIRLTLLTTTVSLFLPSSHAQVIQQVQNSFNLYKQTALHEKLFVHTDKTTYLPGEILWFKIYAVDGSTNKPVNLSKVAYIDILDNNQNPVMQAKVSLKNGSGSGSLYIPVSISNGNYKFRAYTNWMKNFSPELYFEKQITLINPLKSPDAVVANVASIYDIQFFPEGGNLVNGITSKVGFKAVAQNGKGVDLKGAIVDQRNDTIVRFQSLKFGMGSFSVTPNPGSTYRAVFKIGSKTIVKDLPEISTQGYVLALTDDRNGQLEVQVSSSQSGDVYLFVHTRLSVAVAQTASINNGKATFTINTKDLGEGISHFTLFNSNMQPVAERLYFKRPTQQLFIDAAADQQQYDLRKKVSVSVAAKDKAGKSQNADLSMAVYRIDSLQNMDQSSIFSYLWLNADLKGSIENAGYYFKNNNAETDKALDNLMLTQGWSRFSWQHLLQNKTPDFTYLPEFYGHIISGKVTNSVTGAPLKGTLTYLAVPGKRVQVYNSLSDSLGHIMFITKAFYGPNEIVAQTNQTVDSTSRIDIASPFSDQYSKTLLAKFELVNGTQTALQEHSLGIQVLNIYSGARIRAFNVPKMDTSAFYNKPYKTYKLDDFTRFTTMEEDLREYVSEDNIVHTKGHYQIKVLTNDRGFLDGEPLVILDGIPVFNIDKLFLVDPLKVRKLEVVNDRFYYGQANLSGVFSFTTYKGDLGGVDLDPHAVVLDYEGMQLQREFYSPVYNTAAAAASRVPDFRNTLYWTPSIDNMGKAAVSFYTSDQPGKYVGVVQGITADGNAGSQYFTFDVK